MLTCWSYDFISRGIVRWQMLSLLRANREIFTSLGPCRRVQRPVWNVGASAGALAALVGLLLRDVHLDMLQIDSCPKVYGPRGVRGAPALADHWGGRFRLPVALLLPPFTLVLWLALSWGVLFSFGVILVPQTVALKECVQRQEHICNVQIRLMMPDIRYQPAILVHAEILTIQHTISLENKNLSFFMGQQSKSEWKNIEDNLLCWRVPSGWICGRREPTAGSDHNGHNHLSSPHQWCLEGDTVYSYLSCSGWKGRSQTGRSTWWR